MMTIALMLMALAVGWLGGVGSVLVWIYAVEGRKRLDAALVPKAEPLPRPMPLPSGAPAGWDEITDWRKPYVPSPKPKAERQTKWVAAHGELTPLPPRPPLPAGRSSGLLPSVSWDE